MKAGTPILWIAFAMIATVSFAQDTEPTAIFKKVSAAYEAMQTFSAQGSIVADIDSGGMKMNTETDFSIKLKKPNLYLISWDQKNAMMPAINQSGAVWSDGTQPYLYMGAARAYSKMTNDEMALASATGISGGAAFTIPSLFLPAFRKQQADLFSRLISPQLTGAEQVEGEDCLVISGSSTISAKETFWIAKGTYMIRKHSRSLEPPQGGTNVPKMTDQQLEDAMKAMGQQVTPEKKEAMRNMMQQAADAMKTAKVKGTSTETYSKIGQPKLSAEDFDFKVPADAELKASLFGGMFK